MKKQILLISIMLPLAGSILHAQNMDNGSTSPDEAFSSKKGTIIKKQFDEIGKVGSLKIQAERMIDLSAKDTIRCIRLDVLSATGSAGPSALLDTNEANEIINFLKYVTSNVTNHPPGDLSTDISYTSQYNIQVGFWQFNNGWNLYVRTDALNPATETDIIQDDIPAFLKALLAAKAEIENKN